MQEKIIMERTNLGDKIFLIMFFFIASIVMAECTRFCLASYDSETSLLLFGIIPAERLDYGTVVPAGLVSAGGFLVCFIFFLLFIVRGIPFRIAVDSASLVIYFDGLIKFTARILLKDIKTFMSIKNRQAHTIRAVLHDSQKKTIVIVNSRKQDPSSVLKALKECLNLFQPYKNC